MPVSRRSVVRSNCGHATGRLRCAPPSGPRSEGTQRLHPFQVAVDGAGFLTRIGKDRALDVRLDLTRQIHQVDGGGLDARAEIQDAANRRWSQMVLVEKCGEAVSTEASTCQPEISSNRCPQRAIVLPAACRLFRGPNGDRIAMRGCRGRKAQATARQSSSMRRKIGRTSSGARLRSSASRSLSGRRRKQRCPS